MGKEVKLLGTWVSPFSMRIRIALKLKGVDYEFHYEDLTSKSDLLLRSNPVHKKVPVLIHGDAPPIAESLVILEYIDEVWPEGPPIMPSDPSDRAAARFWAAYLDHNFFPALRGIMVCEGGEAEKRKEETMEALDRLEETFVATSGGLGFFGGEKIGFLDVCLGCFVPWIEVIGEMGGANLVDENRTPNLLRWSRRFNSDPAVEEFVPDAGNLRAFAKLFAAKFKGAKL